MLAYGDRLIKFRVTQCHVFHMTAVRKFIHFNVRKKSALEFIFQVNTAMKNGSLKLYH